MSSAARAPGIAALSTAVVIWGSTYVVIKGVLDSIGPFTLAAGRFVLAIVVLLPFAYRAGFRLHHLALRRFWVFGTTGVALYFGLQNLGLVFTTAASGALIAAAIPGATALLAFMRLGERLGGRQWLGIGLSTLGVVLIVGSGLALQDSRAVLGNLLVVGSALAWAAYTVQGRELSASYPAVVSTAASFVTGTVLLLPFAVGEVILQGAPDLHGASLGAVVYLGVVASALTIALWNTALRNVDASLAAPFVNLIPAVGLVFAIGVGESVTALQLSGGVLAGVGVVLTQTRRRAPVPREIVAQPRAPSTVQPHDDAP